MSYTEQLQRIGQKPPRDITDMISEHERLSELYEARKEELDESDEDDPGYEDLANEVETWEKGLDESKEAIDDKIRAWEKELKKTPIAPTPASALAAPSAPQKKSGGIGWLLFGGVVLVLSFGAVNAFKK